MTFLSQVLADFNEWDTGTWVHYSNLSMVKISPKQFHQDPAGIYLFPEKFKTIGNWKTYRYKHLLQLKPGVKILDLAHMDSKSCLALLEKMGIPASEEYVNYIKDTATPNSAPDQMWAWMVQKFMGKPAKFNAALRKAGYDAVFDDTGSIHNAEIQLLVLDPTKVKLLKTIDRKQSGFDVLTKAMQVLKEICSGYGEVTATEPKKKMDRYEQQNVLQATLDCKGEKCEANWKITAAGSSSDSWTGEKKKGERKAKDPPHSKVNAYLSYSTPRLDYGAGSDVDVNNPNWDDYKKRIVQTMDAIWKKGGEKE